MESEILQYLAIAREPVSFSVLASELTRQGSRALNLDAIEALRHRSLIESSGASTGFTLQLTQICLDLVRAERSRASWVATWCCIQRVGLAR